MAAPQIWAGVAAIIVRPPAGGQLTLLNPVVLEEESAEGDEQYEGCLSFSTSGGSSRVR
jgi:peptide deformylase